MGMMVTPNIGKVYGNEASSADLKTVQKMILKAANPESEFSSGTRLQFYNFDNSVPKFDGKNQVEKNQAYMDYCLTIVKHAENFGFDNVKMATNTKGGHVIKFTNNEGKTVIFKPNQDMKYGPFKTEDIYNGLQMSVKDQRFLNKKEIEFIVNKD